MRTDTLLRGFTLLEILVVISIMLIIMGAVLAAFSNFRDYFSLRSAVGDVHGALIDARAATLGAKDDTVHGVHIDEGQVVRFSGASYDSGSTGNIVFPFPVGIAATSSLSGGATEVLFERLTGASQASGTITVTDTRSGSTATITVYTSGLIEL